MKKVKIAADCHVDKKEVKAGEVVELPDEIAEFFGEVLGEEVETVAGLTKLAKDKLVALAVERGVDTVPDSLTKEQIAELILAKK